MGSKILTTACCCKRLSEVILKAIITAESTMALHAGANSAKAALRKDIASKLSLIEDKEKMRQSEIIFQKLKSLPAYQNSKRISVYLSTDGEVDTKPIIKDIFETNRKCFVPRYVGEKMSMLSLHSMEDYEDLPTTKWHIKQPKSAEGRENALETGGLDLVILPGVAFTPGGCRLGHGRGYYDKFLTSLPGQPATVALAFREQVLDQIPCDKHDVIIDDVLYVE